MTPSTQQWWRTAVVYQVWPRSFQDSDGDGVGDLRGVLRRLDHLADLGVDVLWLSPVYPSGGVDAGYDLSDYRGVDPIFGTLADLDALIAGLHARGIRLMLDMVLNHTSDQHPWFAARREFYYWRDEPANDWQALFGGSAWQRDPARGQVYLHTFAPQQPDLDWEQPQVRAALFDVLRFWRDRGVDGFRFDVISMVGKDLAHGTPLGFGPTLHPHLAQLHREVLAGHDLMTVGEMPGVSVEQARLVSDPARAELDMVFGFEHVSLDRGATKWDHVPLRLSLLKQNLARWQQGLAEVGWNSLYWGNHDQPRAVSRFGNDGVHRVASATTLATVLHLHRGTPFVYQGEELGMPNPGFTALSDYRDVESLRHVAAGGTLAELARTSRDNARTPLRWEPAGGFTTGTPWIGSGHHPVPSAAEQRADPDSVFARYRALIALRHAEPAVVHGDFALLLPDEERLWAFTRTYGAVQLLVVANCSAEPLEPPMDQAGELLLGVPGTALGPWESRVIKRTHG